MMLFVGVDVGAHGGIAIIDDKGRVLRAVAMPTTDQDILDVLFWPSREMPLLACRAVLEKVASSPQMGVVSAFSFGGAYRALRMALTAAQLPFDEVKPFAWQRRLECLSGGDKNVTKARAQQLFPGTKIAHSTADSLLLAEFGRRQWADSLTLSSRTSVGAGSGKGRETATATAFSTDADAPTAPIESLGDDLGDLFRKE